MSVLGLDPMNYFLLIFPFTLKCMSGENHKCMSAILIYDGGVVIYSDVGGGVCMVMNNVLNCI